MKLWYQSMSRLAEWGAYPQALQQILLEVKEPDTELEIHGITEIGGTADQYRYLAHLEAGELLKNVGRAMTGGYDAFLIGNTGDPAIREAREIANFPVLGLFECALHVACLMGESFSLVTSNEKFTPRIVENVVRYGLKDRLIAVSRMKMDKLVDLGRAFDDPDVRRRVLDQFNEAARITIEAGAEVVIPASGPVMALLAHLRIHATEDGTPILNGIANLVKMGEMAVRLDRIMGGRFTSKRLQYAPPPSAQIEELRRHYGPDIYPSVK
jgi:allantoin racemase